MRSLPLLVSLLLLAAPAFSQSSSERMTPELLWKLRRLSLGDLSPDGAWVLYALRTFDLAKNGGDTNLWIVPAEGGTARQITQGPESESDVQWVQTQKGLRIFYVAPGESGDKTPQVWSLDPNDKARQQVTQVPEGVANLKVSPTGTHVAFTVDVKLDTTVNELYPDLPHADARIIDQLMFRHWNQWHDYRYSHVHVAALDATGRAKTPLDLMTGLRYDCPLQPFGGSEHIAWSPDGKELALVIKMAKDPAESTDSGIYLAHPSGDGGLRCITPGMPGYDTDPVYSPDGRSLAFLSMERAGFESDRNRIMIFDRGSAETRELTRGLDRTAHDVVWSPDGQAVYFRSEHRGKEQVFRLPLGSASKAPEQITKGSYNWSLKEISRDGKRMIWARQDMLRPWELLSTDGNGENPKPLTDVNGDVFARLELPSVRERWVRASDGASIHNWVIYPPGFDAKKTYPMITYCQGGPQGQIGQSFSYRWNFHLMAAQGYIVLAINRRGLPGFGRAWNDQISRDWGGQAMQDILAATDDLCTEPYIDRERVAAVGASFGGYTVYWLMGHARNRYRCMIAHCGVFNLESMYGATEETFFANWDLGGPYWSSRAVQADYDRFSPHRFVGKWRTPLLVIHGEKDFRVPVTQGIEAFTAAQLQGVPSRFLYFPGEGHWVLSPQNGVLWHRVFFDWIDRYCKTKSQ